MRVDERRARLTADSEHGKEVCPPCNADYREDNDLSALVLPLSSLMAQALGFDPMDRDGLEVRGSLLCTR